jgi:hypothetical protein
VTNLTSNQIDFLKSHNIPLSSVFDASGMRTSDWKEWMKDHEFQFAHGVSECKNRHESIRTRAGHCIQCDHTRIAFMKRNDQEGSIFVAGSASCRLLKLTNASDSHGRLDTLNSQRYGQVADWVMLANAKLVKNAGSVEAVIASRLERFRVGGVYYEKQGRHQQCYDLFACSISTALRELRSVLTNKHLVTLALPDTLRLYEFEDRVTAGLVREGNRCH